MSKIRTFAGHKTTSTHLRRWSVILISTFLLLGTGVTYATNQRPDILLVDEVEFELCMRPILTDYFEANPNRIPSTKISSTNLWRGYVATFTIADGELVVEDIKIMIDFGTVHGVILSRVDGEIVAEDVTIPARLDSSDGEEAWQSVIDEALPESKDRRLKWFSGALHYLQIETIREGNDDRSRYSLKRIDIDNGKYVRTETESTEIHGTSSGIGCSAGWDTEADEGPLTYGWCKVESITSTTCVDSEID